VEIRNFADGLSVRINKSRMRLYVVAYADAIFVRPAFMRFKLATAVVQLKHRRKVQPILAAEFVQIFDGHRPAARVEESLPSLYGDARA
jgi:hypothetical protein